MPVQLSHEDGELTRCECEADRIGRSSWFDFTLKEEAELLA
jgi:hypothetical protein